MSRDSVAVPAALAMVANTLCLTRLTDGFCGARNQPTCIKCRNAAESLLRNSALSARALDWVLRHASGIEKAAEQNASVAALTREAAPQASDAADLLSKESCLLVNGQPRFRTMPDGATLQDYLDKLCIGMLTPVDQMALDNMLHDRLATTDSAIQSQQGATGGAVLDEIYRRYTEMIAADWDKCERVDAIKETLLSLIEFALAHPQAAGSAPVGVEGLLDALARLCDEWEAEAKQRNGQAGRLALRRCAMAVREHIRTTAAAPAVSVGVAKRSTSQSVAFQYLDQVVERQTAAFYSAFSIGTADKIESDAALEKGRAE